MSDAEARASLLVVDDDGISVEILSALARRAGYEVRLAHDGLEGLALAEATPPDVVLLDVDMAGMDGFETCRRLKANPRTAGLPVIFLSGLTGSADKVRAFEAGGADYVDKPFQPQEVLARIAHQVKITRLQAETRAANERLVELDRLKASFAAMLVHDLRSPLTTVYATLGLLARSRPLAEDPELGTLVGYSTEALQKTLAMIAEVLEIYRSEQSPAAPPALVPGDLMPLLRRCAHAAGLEAAERGVELGVTLDGPLPVAHEALRLERAVSNLLGNAFKFTPRGGRVALLAWRLAEAPLVRIEVRDTGDGIPADVLPHVFELYRQADTRQRSAGVGLGLAIVKRIVTAHGGTVAVRSAPGVGTTFAIDLPALGG